MKTIALRFFSFVISLLIGAYRVGFSPFTSSSCRYYPSCSLYALEVNRTHPPGKAIFLIILRLLRCNPFSPGGYDPAPICGKDTSDKIYKTHCKSTFYNHTDED